MNAEVLRRAACIEAEFGPDVDEALARWEETGAEPTGSASAPWLSVAFVFARQLRDHWRRI
jgi:hypothetical protein